MKKVVKVVLSAVMAAVMAVGMLGCSIPGIKAKRDINLDEVHKIKGTLISITRQSAGVMSLEEFEKSSSTISVSYAGDAYIPNPINSVGLKMSDEDFLAVYEFCLDSYENGTFNDYYEDACDGTTYIFTYYDEVGEAHLLYSGYIYNNEALNDVINIITAYSID